MSRDTLRINVNPARADQSIDNLALAEWLRHVNKASRFRWRPDLAVHAGPLGKLSVMVRQFQLKAAEVGFFVAFGRGARVVFRIAVARSRRS